MTTILIEHAQYVDDAGKPIAGGKLYIGTSGADPVATSPITVIYSDRALTVPIANPQSLGSDGRALSKIWVDGEYSIQVNSLVGIVETQEFQDLDAGTAAASLGTLTVNSIIGNNVITGTTSASISEYVANQQFVFTTTAANTGPITLSIDTAGAKDVVKNNDQPILNAEFEASQVVIVAYNAINGNFEWVNQNNKVVDFYIGTSVASAATTNIWGTDGNTVHITGTAGITSLGTAPSAGARRTVVFDGAVTLTNSANLALPGGANYTTAAGDILTVYADTTTQFDVVIHKKDGTAVVVVPIELRVFAYANITNGNFAFGITSGFSAITRTGVGDYNFTFSTTRADAQDYLISTQYTGGALSRTLGVSNVATTGFSASSRDISSGADTDSPFHLVVYEEVT